MKIPPSDYEVILRLEQLESLVEELDEADDEDVPTARESALREIREAGFPSRADLIREIADLHARLDSEFDAPGVATPD